MHKAGFRTGRLDHVHIRVPDRDAAARWYAEHLGFEPVERFDFWAKGFPGGPLQTSADGGQTMLSLFEASEGHPMAPQKTGVAFSLDADHFIAFVARQSSSKPTASSQTATGRASSTRNTDSGSAIHSSSPGSLRR